ncbi:hypothetical protein AAFF_G00093680 [Aldrovandia affinis]|uniref:Uncharacterized protein n=1 Tax=Aldrovandia affinis TaxID=143900 RepID=A0AAD7T2U4_9TELE|nr:hypothetical protein AAFF_G00093680 [Aldrovandia affinis]
MVAGEAVKEFNEGAERSQSFPVCDVEAWGRGFTRTRQPGCCVTALGLHTTALQAHRPTRRHQHRSETCVCPGVQTSRQVSMWHSGRPSWKLGLRG